MTTPVKFNLNLTEEKTIAIIVFLFISLLGFAQTPTVTNIFPTRVTHGSIVRIEGSGFTKAIKNSLTTGTIGRTDVKLESAELITFEIDEKVGNNLNHSNEMDQLITLTGVSYSPIDLNRELDYIGPRAKDLRSNRDFRVDEIYTNWDWNGSGFWSSTNYISSPDNNNTWPNDKHELIGFKMTDGTIYSTNVDNDLLLLALGEDPENPPMTLPYEDTRYRAYSTNGVLGRTNSSHFILTGDLIDTDNNGNILVGIDENLTNGNIASLPEISEISIFDVIIDGTNGLELGTGISNFNNNISVKFFSGNGKPGVIGDNEPDLLITQIAQAGGYDIYFYADEEDNVVGTPIEIFIPNDNNTIIAEWQLDLFSFPQNQPIVSTSPNKRGQTGNEDQNRPIRMIGFKLEDFDIDATGLKENNVNHIENINNINMVAGGTADIAFLAYNAGTFDIKSPIANPLLSKFVCVADGSSNVTFEVAAGVDDGSGGITAPISGQDPDQLLNFEWSKFNIPLSGPQTDSRTINSVGTNDLATYKVKISNEGGTIILPVSLSEGGTPTFWNGSAWTSPFGTVADEDRNLVFSTDYSESGDLVGCDCVVASGSTVIIDEDDTLLLYDELIVQPEILEDIDEGISQVDAGVIIFENNASLVQIKNVTLNQNSGEIIMKRNPKAENLKPFDFVYWSSPVEEFEIGNITGNATYAWDPTINNSTISTYGNWTGVADTEEMLLGKGYIKRWNEESAPAGEAFAEFTGLPRNGIYTVPLALSPSEAVDDYNQDAGELNWNLIGNPYPSAINVKTFLEVNAGTIDGGVNLWTHGSPRAAGNPTPFYQSGGGETYSPSDYITSNGTGSNPPEFEGNIASGQGFFVKALAVGNVVFNNTMRYDDGTNGGNGNADPDSGTYGNDNFFRGAKTTKRNNSSNDQKLWLSIINQNQMASTTLIGYVDGATLQKDNLYDATANGTNFGIYSLIDEQKMIIQGRPAPFTNTDVVPVGVNLSQAGVYSIGIDLLKGSEFVDNEQDIFIEDVYLNMVHDLRQSPYSFTAEPGEIKDRFLLRYTNNNATLSVANQNILNTFVFVNAQTLNIKSNKQITTVEVFDLTGKRVVRHYAMRETELKKDFNYANGVYLVNVLFEDGSTLTKKVLN